MMHLTVIHWVIIAIFLFLFVVLSLLALREKSTKSMLSMVFASFILSIFAIVISLVVLDKYIKKAKIISFNTQRDFAHESVIVRGVIQNVGKYDIGYCNLEIRISNGALGARTPSSYFTPTKGLDFMGSGGRKNTLTEEVEVSQSLRPGEKKNFFVTIRFPSYFEKPKYKLKLNCH